MTFIVHNIPNISEFNRCWQIFFSVIFIIFLRKCYGLAVLFELFSKPPSSFLTLLRLAKYYRLHKSSITICKNQNKQDILREKFYSFRKNKTWWSC